MRVMKWQEGELGIIKKSKKKKRKKKGFKKCTLREEKKEAG